MCNITLAKVMYVSINNNTLTITCKVTNTEKALLCLYSGRLLNGDGGDELYK